MARQVKMCKKQNTHNKEFTKVVFDIKTPTLAGQQPDHWGAYNLVTKTLMEHYQAKYNFGEAPRGGQERILQDSLN